MITLQNFSAILIPASDSIPKASADSLVSGLINGAFLLAGMIAVISIALSGFRFITANGDASKVTKARQGILYSTIGLAVIAGAFGIVRFVMTAITG